MDFAERLDRLPDRAARSAITDAHAALRGNDLRRFMKLRAFLLLAALFSGLVTPAVTVTAVQAQGLSQGGGRSQVNRGQVNRGNVNRGNVNRGNVNRGNVNRGHVNRGHVNRGHVNRSHVGRPHHRPPRHHVRPHHRSNIVVVHPRRHWNRGGAVAAGAAIGFIAGAAAASWAGPPPRAGYCWFYTTPARTHGFWDWCPR